MAALRPGDGEQVEQSFLERMGSQFDRAEDDMRAAVDSALLVGVVVELGGS